MLDPLGQVVVGMWRGTNQRVLRRTDYRARLFVLLFSGKYIRGRPEEVLRMTAASGRIRKRYARAERRLTISSACHLTALRDADGSLRGFSEIGRDLSESEESEAKYRGLLETAPGPTAVVNPSGKIVLVNVQAEKRFGYSRDELIGQQVKNIIPRGLRGTSDRGRASICGRRYGAGDRYGDRSHWAAEGWQ